MTKPTAKAISGKLVHANYSRKGAIDGFLMTANGDPVQIVFSGKDKRYAGELGRHRARAKITVRAKPQRSTKNKSKHQVLKLIELISINGKKPRKRKLAISDVFFGVVARLNYSKHGAPNGLVLDGGEFVYIKVHRKSNLKFEVGDEVRVKGKPTLAPSGGVKIEASRINIAKPQRISMTGDDDAQL